MASGRIPLAMSAFHATPIAKLAMTPTKPTVCRAIPEPTWKGLLVEPTVKLPATGKILQPTHVSNVRQPVPRVKALRPLAMDVQRLQLSTS